MKNKNNKLIQEQKRIYALLGICDKHAFRFCDAENKKSSAQIKVTANLERVGESLMSTSWLFFSCISFLVFCMAILIETSIASVTYGSLVSEDFAWTTYLVGTFIPCTTLLLCYVLERAFHGNFSTLNDKVIFFTALFSAIALLAGLYILGDNATAGSKDDLFKNLKFISVGVVLTEFVLGFIFLDKIFSSFTILFNRRVIVNAQSKMYRFAMLTSESWRDLLPEMSSFNKLNPDEEPIEGGSPLIYRAIFYFNNGKSDDPDNSDYNASAPENTPVTDNSPQNSSANDGSDRTDSNDSTTEDEVERFISDDEQNIKF